MVILRVRLRYFAKGVRYNANGGRNIKIQMCGANTLPYFNDIQLRTSFIFYSSFTDDFFKKETRV